MPDVAVNLAMALYSNLVELVKPGFFHWRCRSRIERMPDLPWNQHWEGANC